MPTFQYYLPGQTVGTCDRDAIRKAGLGEIFRDCLASQLVFQQRIIVHQVHANGPGQVRSGVILCAQPGAGEGLDQRVGYYPAEQEWVDCASLCGKRKAENGERETGFWIGWDKDKRPTPEGLRRHPIVPGYPTVLGDGNTWECPTIRRGGIEANLPRSMGIDDEGKFVLRVMPDFDWAWQLGGEIFDRVFGSPTLPWADAYSLCVRALSINYRIGPREASILGLLTTENFQRVFDAAVDWDVVAELLAAESPEDVPDVKKNDADPAPEPVTCSPGPAAETPNIAPVGATCI